MAAAAVVDEAVEDELEDEEALRRLPCDLALSEDVGACLEEAEKGERRRRRLQRPSRRV